jgi:hypothetical protein
MGGKYGLSLARIGSPTVRNEPHLQALNLHRTMDEANAPIAAAATPRHSMLEGINA